VNDRDNENLTGPVSGEYVDGAEHVIGTDPRRVPENIDPETGLPREDGQADDQPQPVDHPKQAGKAKA